MPNARSLQGLGRKRRESCILGALDLSERTADEVILHRSGFEMNTADGSSDAVPRYCCQSRHTRFPVYFDEPENIIDLLPAKEIMQPFKKLIGGSNYPKNSKKSFKSSDVL
ncbi:MAG: hypothetical protein OXC63_03555 [Aestuariivita sp.]|nr:hypothetical protein [Aestuariivita sp.]MCY4346939.1 hypothetical protein [Aestuariivita sp.]